MSNIKEYQAGFEEGKVAMKEYLIKEFLYKIRHMPLFWVLGNERLEEVYNRIDEIRDYYQKKLNLLNLKQFNGDD